MRRAALLLLALGCSALPACARTVGFSFLCAWMLTGCALVGRYAIGREYTLVGIQWGAITAMECDRLYSLEPSTLFCKFDGAPARGYAAISGVVPFPTGVMRVISANGMATTKAPTIRPIPTSVLGECPPPDRRVYPITVGQALTLMKWEECLASNL